MRLTLIGPGDIEYHYSEILGLNRKQLDSELEQIAQAIVNSGVDIEFLPDKGICLEIAKLYKKKEGKKVIGSVPKSDKTFGIKHLQPYIEEKVNGKSLFDEIIDTENWFKHDLIKGLLGNAVLYLGSSPGTNGELNYAVYLYKLMTGNKKGVEVAGKFIHPEIRAGKDYTIFVYSPFVLTGKLPKESESYIKKSGINLVYIKNPGQLEKELKKFD